VERVSSNNPFADLPYPHLAPHEAAASRPLQDVDLVPFAGLWRHGDLLVMHKLAPLPDICVKSNQAATRRILCSLYWLDPTEYEFLLRSSFISTMKTANIYLPLTEEWYRKRQRRLFFAYCASLFGIAVFLGLAVMLDPPHPAGTKLYVGPFFIGLLIIGLFIAAGALIYWWLSGEMVRPARMTDQYIWLKGVHPDFLNRLEAWQWNV
jgi:hypothetical protein